jgi:hypothetical protein
MTLPTRIKRSAGVANTRKLKHDGQQFHQYQQNEQSPLTLNH